MKDNKQIIFVGSFSIPNNGHYGGVLVACRNIEKKLVDESYKLVKLDITLKDISKRSIIKRLPSLIIRNISFLIKILINHRAKSILIFTSSGSSYIDKLPILLLAKMLNIQIVLFPRSGHILKDFDKLYYKPFIIGALHLSDFIICQSKFWFDLFAKKNIDTSKLTIIENWVSDDLLDKSKTLQFNNYTHGHTYKIIVVSRIEQSKEINKLIYLAKTLGPIAEINVYGSGSALNDFLGLINKEKVNHVIKYKGWLDVSNKQDIINSHNLALFLSRTEGYPNTLLEYIFSKTVILCPNLPMISVITGSNVEYYKPANLEDLINRVRYTMNNHDQLINKAKILYDEKFKINNLYTAFLKLQKII